MKPTMALKPLVFALTALMAIAAQANGGSNGGGGNHGGGGSQPAAPTVLAVTANDAQNSSGNGTLNYKTENNASTTDSVNHNTGVASGIVQSGTGNQAKHDVAIGAADDADQVFATINTTQNSSGNLVGNIGNETNSSLTNSNNSNSGVSLASVQAGTGNQSSQGIAIASSDDGKSGGAAVNAQQNSSGNLTLNATTGHGWNKSSLVTNASLTNSGNYNSGVSGTVSQAGNGNQAALGVSITKF